MKFVIFLVLLLLNGCALGPYSHDYPSQAEKARRSVPAWTESAGTEQAESGIANYLTDLLSSPELDSLIAEGLRANPDLQQTWLTLQIRQSEWEQTFGQRVPGVGLGLNYSNEDQAEAHYTGSLTVSWQADIWQQLGDRSQAAGKTVEQHEELHRAASDTLAAQIMTGWLGIIAQKRSISIQQQRISTLSKNETFIVQRYRKGLGSLDDLNFARSNLASARADLEALQESLAQQQRSLQQLLGRSEKSLVVVPDQYPKVLLPLVELPDQTLERRPDLRAAFAAIASDQLSAYASYKDLLPRLSISGSLTDSAYSPREALLTDPLWSLLGQLTAPVFQGGQLRKAVDIAQLQTARSFEEYRSTLLTAVREVEDALGQEVSLATQQRHIGDSLDNARVVLQQYRSRYRSGLTNIIDLLTVEQQTYDFENQLNSLTYQRLSNRITLGLALGLGVAT